MRKLLLFFFSIVFSVITSFATTIDEIPNVHRVDRNLFVSDQARIFSPSTLSDLNQIAGEIWHNTSAEVAVVTVDELPEQMTADEFATALFEKWGIGKRDNDNGLLLLICPGARRAILRTGYGVEGAVPDIVAGRIIRDIMMPSFRQGNYDKGTTDAMKAISDILSNPSLAQELKSKYENDAVRPNDSVDLFTLYFYFCCIASGAMLVFLFIEILSTRKLDMVLRYRRLQSWKSTSLFIAIATMGIGLLPFLLLVWKMHRLRRHKRLCPHCQTKMKLVDEENDNAYLTPSQDAEEQLGSVDYDVWQCPGCNTLEIFPYENLKSSYKVCPRCGAKALAHIKTVEMVPATTTSPGVARDIYECKHCHNQVNNDRKTPLKSDPAAAIAAAAILGGMASGRGGGGFSGGSFGGGSTGGGGAGGSW